MGNTKHNQIYEDGTLLLALYKQYDGYPDGWGKKLKDFLHKGFLSTDFAEVKNSFSLTVSVILCFCSSKNSKMEQVVCTLQQKTTSRNIITL
jgi:hypothetical protein